MPVSAAASTTPSGDPKEWDFEELQRWLNGSWPQHASKLRYMNGHVVSLLPKSFFLQWPPDGPVIYNAWHSLVEARGTRCPLASLVNVGSTMYNDVR